MENGSLKDEVKKIIQWFYELHQIKILLIKDLCIQPGIVRPSLWLRNIWKWNQFRM